MTSDSPLARLAALLEDSGAQVDVNPERLAPSAIYDLEYRVAVVALVFNAYAAEDRFSSRPRLQARRLKLLQFIAIRPWLVPVIREWSRTRRDKARSLDYEEGLRRGFISDTMHERVMDFLVAAGALRREESFVVPGGRFDVLAELQSATRGADLFVMEAEALEHLKAVVITNDMLEGW